MRKRQAFSLAILAHIKVHQQVGGIEPGSVRPIGRHWLTTRYPAISNTSQLTHFASERGQIILVKI